MSDKDLSVYNDNQIKEKISKELKDWEYDGKWIRNDLRLIVERNANGNKYSWTSIRGCIILT